MFFGRKLYLSIQYLIISLRTLDYLVKMLLKKLYNLRNLIMIGYLVCKLTRSLICLSVPPFLSTSSGFILLNVSFSENFPCISQFCFCEMLQYLCLTTMGNCGTIHILHKKSFCPVKHIVCKFLNVKQMQIELDIYKCGRNRDADKIWDLLFFNTV